MACENDNLKNKVEKSIVDLQWHMSTSSWLLSSLMAYSTGSFQSNIVSGFTDLIIHK